MIRILILASLLTGVAWADATPDATARRLFDAAKKYDDKFSKHFGEVCSTMTDEFYTQLTRAYTWQPPHDFLDFDPFSNSQMGASGYVLGKARISGNQARVPVTVNIAHGGTSKYTCVLTAKNGDWRISNFVYDTFNLMTELHKLNK